MTITQTLFSFQGRIRRTTYWLAHLGLIGVVFAICLIFGVIGGMLGAAAGVGQSDGASGPALALGLLVMAVFLPLWVVMVWSGLALAVKRCHDRDYPGVMILIGLIPVVGWLWTLIDLGFIDGTQGPNRFGPSPKGIGGPALGAVFA